jgi:hypothetical protein
VRVISCDVDESDTTRRFALPIVPLADLGVQALAPPWSSVC